MSALLPLCVMCCNPSGQLGASEGWSKPVAPNLFHMCIICSLTSNVLSFSLKIHSCCLFKDNYC